MQRAFVDGRYVVDRLLGGGGTAQVYLTHDEILDRPVALKILREQYVEDEEFVERFRREARSVASLSHPNIVSIYDQGRSEEGAYYIAMEYVPGGTLKERISREGALTPEAAVEVALQITDPLQEAHEKGVIHRDIKPQNVLLSAKGAVKVTDFGIAKAVAPTSPGATTTGVILGTAEYMSPEQAKGEPAAVGPSTDLYSLGVVLYEMLSGTLPYQAESPIGAAIKHVTEPVRSPREAKADVPEPLAALTAKLLAKNPQDRYPSAAALSADLERIRSGLPPVAANAKVAQETTVPLSSPVPLHEEERTKRTAIQPTTAAPSTDAAGRTKRGQGRLWRPLFALLLVGLLVLGGGILWALTRDTADPPQAKDAPSSRMVQVPHLVYAETAQTDLAAVGLELGRQDEVPSDAATVGMVIEQTPAQGTQVEEGTPVDIVVSTGPGQAPISGQQAPISSGQDEEKQWEKQQEEVEKQGEKQQQEAEKQREKQQEEVEKRNEEQGD